MSDAMDVNSCVLFELLVDRLRSAMPSPAAPPASPFAREEAAATAAALAGERLRGEVIRVHWPSRHRDTSFYPPGGYSETTYIQVHSTHVVISCHHTLSMHLIITSYPVNTQASSASASAGSQSQSQSQAHHPNLDGSGGDSKSSPPPTHPPLKSGAGASTALSPTSAEGVPTTPCPYATHVYPITGPSLVLSPRTSTNPPTTNTTPSQHPSRRTPFQHSPLNTT